METWNNKRMQLQLARIVSAACPQILFWVIAQVVMAVI